jgi:hypothetical protein
MGGGTAGQQMWAASAVERVVTNDLCGLTLI